MPMAKTRRGRLRQIEGWLRANFPTAYPVTVTVARLGKPDAKLGDYGEFSRRGKRCYIRIDNRLTWHPATETLLHEWAHAVSLKHDNLESRRAGGAHDEGWGLNYARIYRRYFDEDGVIESRGFPG